MEGKPAILFNFKEIALNPLAKTCDGGNPPVRVIAKELVAVVETNNAAFQSIAAFSKTSSGD
jgi:hypothetical protein